jgi:hypothetical protein
MGVACGVTWVAFGAEYWDDVGAKGDAAAGTLLPRHWQYGTVANRRITAARGATAPDAARRRLRTRR